MAFITKEWKDRIVEYAGRRRLTNVSTQAQEIVDVERAEGTVSQAGDAFSAANMNDLEQRISDEFTAVNENLTANGGIYSSFPFRVGVTSDGQLGFHDIVGGADTVRPFRNVNPVLCAVSGSTNSFSIPNADIGSIYLMFYTSKTGTYNWEEPQTIGNWGVIDKSTYSVSGGELIKVLERYITSWLPYFTKMIFVRATASTVTVTTNPDQLNTYDSPSDCIAIKLC